MPLTARERELTARHLLAHQDQIPVCLKNRQWEQLSALVQFARQDAPEPLAHTDPALYRTLRHQITEYHLRGWSRLSLRRLQALARQDQAVPTKAKSRNRARAT